MFLATYIHNLNPVIFDVWGPLKLRWYGLGYLLGFVCGYFLLKWLAQRKLWVMPASKVGDFIAYAAFFGVFLGGRLGYILFYQIPKNHFQGFDELLADPLMIIRVHDGGMSSHGGILGLMIFTYFYAKKHKVSWTAIGDGLCVVAPIGIFFVRIANFINGELYGRFANGVAWAVKFPNALFDDLGYAKQGAQEALRACYAKAPELIHAPYSALVEKSRTDVALLETLGSYLRERHPSQIYEALLEGLALFLILFTLRVARPRLAEGILTGCFFIMYAFFRIVVENFREPDAALVMGLTKGQFYSLFMIVIGGIFLVRGLQKKSVKPS